MRAIIAQSASSENYRSKKKEARSLAPLSGKVAQ